MSELPFRSARELAAEIKSKKSARRNCSSCISAASKRTIPSSMPLSRRSCRKRAHAQKPLTKPWRAVKIGGRCTAFQ